MQTRSFAPKGKWIGLEGDPLHPNYYPGFLNPKGKCRCGMGEYIHCHLSKDLNEPLLFNPNLDGTKKSYINFLVSNWDKTRRKPHNSVISQLKKAMLLDGIKII